MSRYTIFIPTEQEIKTIFPDSKLTEKNGFKGVYHNDRFIYISGIGKTNTAITFTKYLCTYPDVITTPLLMGIAGAYYATPFAIGDLAVIEDDFFVDEAKLDGNTLDSTSLLGFPVAPGNKVSFRSDDFDLPICNANTVSLLPGDQAMAEIYHKATGAHLESMEGAAFGMVAKSFGIEAVHVRAVSNFCASDEWDPKKACRVLASFIDEIL